MIEKNIEFFYGDNNSEVLSLIHPSTLEKRAGLSEEIAAYIQGLKAAKGKTYALVNALSAGEFFGPNRNGDYFPEDELIKHHKTFEELGHIYKHHVNKDPQKSLGKVIFSHYNDTMKRVELVLEILDEKAKDIIEDLNKGALPAVSMGTRVPYDVCSICGNKAKSRNEYCTCLKTMLNRILPDGRKVYAINIRPKFFDISIVLIPAEKTAGFLKVFKDLPEDTTNSIEKFAFYDSSLYIKLAELSNTAEIRKEISSETDIAFSKNPEELIQAAKLKPKNLDKELVQKLAEFNFNDTLSTMLGLRIFPSKKDFQKLALYSMGENELADKLEAQGQVFDINSNTKPYDLDEVSVSKFNEKVAELLVPVVPAIGLTKELVVARELIKVAQENFQWQQQPPTERSFLHRVLFDYEQEPTLTPTKNPIMPLGVLGGLYFGYAKLFNDKSTTGFRHFMLEHPWLLPVLIGGGAIGSVWAQQNEFSKTAGLTDRFVRNSLVTLPVSYYFSGKYQNKAQQGIPISDTQNFVRKHPMLTALLASFAGAKMEEMVTKVASVVAKLPENKFDELYTDILNLT